MTQTVSIKETWKSMLPALLALYKHGDNTGRKEAEKELLRMAEIADRFADFTEGEAEAPEPITE